MDSFRASHQPHPALRVLAPAGGASTLTSSDKAFISPCLLESRPCLCYHKTKALARPHPALLLPPRSPAQLSCIPVTSATSRLLPASVQTLLRPGELSFLHPLKPCISPGLFSTGQLYKACSDPLPHPRHVLRVSTMTSPPAACGLGCSSVANVTLCHCPKLSRRRPFPVPTTRLGSQPVLSTKESVLGVESQAAEWHALPWTLWAPESLRPL